MSTSFDNIVVALRTPDDDDALLAYASTIARLGGTKCLRLVHVADSDTPAATLRDRMRNRATPLFDGLPVRITCEVLRGSLTDRLLAYVAEFQADLVLIGSKKRRLGARLAMTGPCSVAIVPADYHGGLSHLMLAVDFSEGSTTTLRWATRLVAADPGIRCTALHVMTHESTDLFGEGESESEQAERMRRFLAEGHQHPIEIEPRLAAVDRSGDVTLTHPFSLAASIEGADVAHTILTEAQVLGADCIALSTRGRSRSASILLGSVTEKVIERSPVPLLVGKHAGHHLSLVSLLLGHGPERPIKTN